MRKRLLAIICLLTVCVGCVCFGSMANAAAERYRVGYAIRDINPWVNPDDHSKGLLPVQLTGNGNDSERTCTGIMDDNDNGVADDGDGLFTTATAVTDPYGKTVIYITVDFLQGRGDVTADARNAIVSALGAGVVSADQIMVNANHTHSAPSFSRTSNTAYYNYVVDQITDAAIEAYNDRAEAVMTKGSVDALESTAYLGYNGGNGYYMNAIRHYDVTSVHQSGLFTKQHVAGSSFGGMSTTMKQYKETGRSNVMDSDNTMHLLLFEFPENTEKEPIVFVNWRAHSTTNSGGSTKTLVSSDFANSIRANLKKAGYRAAFMQGAAGNVVTKSTQLNDWTAECGNVANANVYGRILANIAVDCIDRNMTKELPAGRIRTLQKIYHGQLQQDSAGLQAAAKVAAASNVQYPYSYKHTDGKTYILNSTFHTNAIITRSKAADSYTDLELNVILLGKNVAFVTAPGELADRYDLAGSTKNEDNDWLELINDKTYGIPFVLAYTNEGKGYIPFSLEYAYNTYEYYQITKKGLNGNEFHGAGSYEANTSRLARGSGEDIIQTFKQMFSDVDELCYFAQCEACNSDVEWKPIIGSYTGELKPGSGHYYMCNDLTSCRFVLNKGETLCLDLKGYKIETSARCFTFASGATLSLFDSVGTGKVISHTGGSNVAGGTTSVVANSVFNIYGGTLQFVPKTVNSNVYETGRGAVIACDGTTNMYGGTLIGSELVKSSYWSANDKSNGCGGTVYVSGTFNAYGGRIISGKAAEGALGDCVYLASTAARFSLSGNAVIDEIFIYDNSGKQVIVNGAFTGKAALRFNPDKDTLKLETDIGDHITGSFTAENLYTSSHPEFTIGMVEGQLKLVEWGKTAVISSSSGNKPFDSLSTALSQYSTGNRIMLLKDIEEAVTISKDTYIDLNGYSITGKINVVYGKTLYCWDSETDDYSVSDEKYGKLTNVSGNVAGVPSGLDYTDNQYLMIQEDGAYSFHRVDLRLTNMSLRPENAGIYYTSKFAGDQVVACHVKQFGIVMSVKQIPNEGNFETDCAYSWFDGFQAGTNTSKTGTILTNIMRKINPTSINKQNSEIPIHGRAYIQLKDGTYLFGESASRSLRMQVEDIDSGWTSLSTTQKNGMLAMYKTYADVMDAWKIPNLIAAAKAS